MIKKIRIAASQGAPRVGKTAKDRKSGYSARRMANRDARNAYVQKASSDVNLSNLSFPYHACNGQANRSRWTSRGNQTTFQTSRLHK